MLEHMALVKIGKAAQLLGVDVKTPATLSSGVKVAGPKAHKVLLEHVRRLSRALSRKKKGSANRRNAQTKLARLHARIANIRGDALHKLTPGLVLNHEVIGNESLNVIGMVKTGGSPATSWTSRATSSAVSLNTNPRCTPARSLSQAGCSPAPNCARRAQTRTLRWFSAWMSGVVHPAAAFMIVTRTP